VRGRNDAKRGCAIEVKAIGPYHDHLQATNKFYLSAVVLSDPVLDTIRRELRRVSDVKVDFEELRTLLKEEVIKREVLEGEKADAAHKKVTKSANKMLRIRKDDEEEPPSAPAHSLIVPDAPKRVEEA
jgi:hypothetical protein